ncbi:MAG TPA: hypothetical protein PLV93_02735, partial [Microthrixaceae bacterium]|nr:hypothetical protein [Microthrixaceae bacterium]
TLNKRLESIAWGLFLILLGCQAFIPQERVNEGYWSIGVGLILLGLNGARYLNQIRMSGFTTILGLIALVTGIGELAGVDLPGLAHEKRVQSHRVGHGIEPGEPGPPHPQARVRSGDRTKWQLVGGHAAVVGFEVRFHPGSGCHGRLHPALCRVITVEVRHGRPALQHTPREREGVVAGALVFDETSLAVVAGAHGELVEPGRIKDLAYEPDRFRRTVVRRARDRQVPIVETETFDHTGGCGGGRLKGFGRRPHEGAPFGVTRRRLSEKVPV